MIGGPVESCCACCGAELPHDDRGRRFCGSACRQAAYRRRSIGQPEARPCCAHCRTPLDPQPQPGFPRRFCPGGRCRQAAWRRRRAGVPESTAGLEPGGRRRLVHRAHAERWSRMSDRGLDHLQQPLDVEDLVAELLADLDGVEA
jgi:hypothetical protein